MNTRRFIGQLSILSLCVLLVITALLYFPAFQASFRFAVVSLVFFIGLSFIIFIAAKPAAISRDKNAFTRLVLAFTLGKMALVVALVIIFYRVLLLKGNYFLIPFFFIYIVFTAYETYFLTKIGRQTKKAEKQN